jgi:hypothetical protein
MVRVLRPLLVIVMERGALTVLTAVGPKLIEGVEDLIRACVNGEEQMATRTSKRLRKNLDKMFSVARDTLVAYSGGTPTLLVQTKIEARLFGELLFGRTV